MPGQALPTLAPRLGGGVFRSRAPGASFAPRAVCGVSTGLMLVYVVLRRRAAVTYDALRLTLVFPSRFADNKIISFVIAIH